MSRHWLLSSILLVGVLAILAGCQKNKSDESKSSSEDNAKEKEESTEPNGTPTVQPGEAKYKVTSKEFIKEYVTKAPAANAKYKGAIVELSGTVFRSAGPELDNFGMPVSQTDGHKVSFVFGEPDAKRAETVIVYGLKPSAVGKVLRGGTASVKGRVGKHQSAHPIEVFDAELLGTGGEATAGLGKTPRDMKDGANGEVSGIVTGKGDDGGEYIEVKAMDGQKYPCYLLTGVGVFYPSGFPEGMRIVCVGTWKRETVMMPGGGTFERFALREAVPLHRDPKAKW